MTNSEIFIYPGNKLTDFALSIFNLSASSVDDELYLILSVLLALYFWCAVFRLTIAIIKKATGFEAGQ